MPNEGAEADVLPGQVIAGKYQVTRMLGRGGMGVVVEARRIGLGERVAIKVLHAHYCNHPEAVARFQNEARAAVRIRGEHSARVLDVGTSEAGLPFIVMELLEGSDLSHVMRVGRVTLQEAVLYILQACEGMAEVHANGIIHRDLKPGNLFLTRRPDGSPLVKVLDFGVAKSAFPTEDSAEQNLTMTLVAARRRADRHLVARGDPIRARLRPGRVRRQHGREHHRAGPRGRPAPDHLHPPRAPSGARSSRAQGAREAARAPLGRRRRVRGRAGALHRRGRPRARR
ncbi:MAG: serine/threonine protein kinase, partial [Polyangiaceae bacterium]|nr:serine/threonine protein kinase [Polyangiaceae bacterium]